MLNEAEGGWTAQWNPEEIDVDSLDKIYNIKFEQDSEVKETEAPAGPKMSDSEYRLYYFDIQGRAEATRLIFAYAQVPFIDCRIQWEHWPGAYQAMMPFGKMPALEVDGIMLGQSQAINRFLAKRFGLTGKDEWESVKCDMLVDGMMDVLTEMRPWFVEDDAEKAKQLWRGMEEELLGKTLYRYTKFLEQNGTDYFVGNHLTYTDLQLFTVFQMWQSNSPELIDRFPKIAHFLKRIEDIPQIKNWMAQRPRSKWRM